MRRWPEKWACLKDSLIGKKINQKTGKLANHYRCASCKGEFTSKDVEIDHIEPVVDPQKGFETWDVFISRLYVPKEQLQTLCKRCHKEKTNKEKQVRRKNV